MEEINNCPSLEGVISKGHCAESFSGLGSTVYIGVKKPDGSMPDMADMQPVEIKESIPFNAEDEWAEQEEKKGWTQSFSVDIKPSQEEEELGKAEYKIIRCLAGNAKRLMDVRVPVFLKMKGRKRKEHLRALIQYFKATKEMIMTGKSVLSLEPRMEVSKMLDDYIGFCMMYMGKVWVSHSVDMSDQDEHIFPVITVEMRIRKGRFVMKHIIKKTVNNNEKQNHN